MPSKGHFAAVWFVVGPLPSTAEGTKETGFFFFLSSFVWLRISRWVLELKVFLRSHVAP